MEVASSGTPPLRWTVAHSIPRAGELAAQLIVWLPRRSALSRVCVAMDQTRRYHRVDDARVSRRGSMRDVRQKSGVTARGGSKRPDDEMREDAADA